MAQLFAPSADVAIEGMDPAWIGTISALAGAGLTGVLGLGRDFFRSRRELDQARAQRDLEVEERRFDIRSDVYVSFAADCHRIVATTDKFSIEHGDLVPGGYGWEGPHQDLLAALDRIRIIGPPRAVEVATHASLMLHGWTFASGEANREDADAAVEQFSQLAQELLKFA